MKLSSNKSPIVIDKFDKLKQSIKSRYGFNEDELQRVLKSFGINHYSSVLEEFANNALRIKGMGFYKKEILDIVEYMGEGAIPLKTWKGIAPVRWRFENDSQRMIYAFMAGLDTEQIASMSDEDLSIEKLEVLAKIRTL